MALIHIPDYPKSLESTDLEAHVALCSERYKKLDENSARLEKKIELMIETNKENRKMFIGALVTLATGIVSYLISSLIRMYS
jgi:hypothetical protein